MRANKYDTAITHHVGQTREFPFFLRLKERGDIESLRRAQRSGRAHINAADVIPKGIITSIMVMHEQFFCPS